MNQKATPYPFQIKLMYVSKKPVKVRVQRKDFTQCWIFHSVGYSTVTSGLGVSS